MPRLTTRDVLTYVEDNIAVFHEKRVACLHALKLKTVLTKKNPYLFRAKYLLTAEQIVRALADAFLSSNEETIFGDWLEGLVVFINGKVYHGRKSGITGIDLEFDKDGIRYIVTIKSGPNWGNSGQIKKMIVDFRTAKRTLRTSNSNLRVEAVNGCCYGRENNPDKGDYLKYCGQRFWEFISGNKNLYKEIIEPLGHLAKEKNELFAEEYGKMINKFTQEFVDNFCLSDGSIDWKKLIEFNSSIKVENKDY